MGLNVRGAGQYGAMPGGGNSIRKLATPATGNSKLLEAKTVNALTNLARSQTQKFISNGRQVAQGASGRSSISIKA